ncbi:MAG TPA: acylphosphatase [Promineifilum sp.]|nr:acylphosphatase [Promineifilum sp.]
MSVRMEATVTGLVQGVFFRQSTLYTAQRLKLVGWVANRSDGAVWVVAEGDEDVVQQFLAYLHDGPPAARVEKVEAKWSAATDEFPDFRVRYL